MMNNPISDHEYDEVSMCPVCGSTNWTPLLDRPDRDLITLRIWKCAGCETAFLNPRLSKSAVERLETENVFYDYDRAHVEHIIQILMGLVTDLEAQLPPHEQGQKRMLDVGCNRGFLLEAAHRLGWEVAGVDISSAAIEKASSDWGFEHLYAGEIGAIPTESTFDLITCWHVLEHTHDPVSFLSDLSLHLSSNGVIAIQVPSYTHYNEYKSRNMETSLVCSVHNFLFAPRTIKTTAERAGLSVMSTSDSPDDLMLTVMCRRMSWHKKARRSLVKVIAALSSN